MRNQGDPIQNKFWRGSKYFIEIWALPPYYDGLLILIVRAWTRLAITHHCWYWLKNISPVFGGMFTSGFVDFNRGRHWDRKRR